MSFVKYPDFTIYDVTGLSHIKCKVCGASIAGMEERIKEVVPTRDGGRLETRVIQFTRFPNFTELKMVCAPGEFHVTNGCNKCLVASLTPQELGELMEADLQEQRRWLHPEYFTEMMARVPTAVVAVKVGGGIL